MRMIFVNLPVRDVNASRAFFSAIGFSHNPAFSDDVTACIVISEQIYVMVMEHARFKDFIRQPIGDARKATEVLLALSCESRTEVDDIRAKALAAGGSEWMPSQDHGFMYGASFQDIDGHVWELTWMDPAAIPA
jgi:predicted lactoylglutathione lyase